MDIKNFSDDQLDQLRVDVAIELEHRESIKRIPQQVAELSRAYTAGGGDHEALIQALTPDPELAPE